VLESRPTRASKNRPEVKKLLHSNTIFILTPLLNVHFYVVVVIIIIVVVVVVYLSVIVFFIEWGSMESEKKEDVVLSPIDVSYPVHSNSLKSLEIEATKTYNTPDGRPPYYRYVECITTIFKRNNTKKSHKEITHANTQHTTHKTQSTQHKQNTSQSQSHPHSVGVIFVC
jgi:hypothetical protein